jgi:chromosome segregation ATPase
VGEEEATMAETTGGEIAEVLRVMRGMQETVQGLSSRVREMALAQFGADTLVRGLQTRMDGQSAQLSALASRIDGRMDGMTSRMDGMTSRMDGMTSRMEEQSAQLSALTTLVEEKAKLLEGLGGEFMHLHSALEARVQRTEEHCEALDRRVQVLEER